MPRPSVSPGYQLGGPGQRCEKHQPQVRHNFFFCSGFGWDSWSLVWYLLRPAVKSWAQAVAKSFCNRALSDIFVPGILGYLSKLSDLREGGGKNLSLLQYSVIYMLLYSIKKKKGNQLTQCWNVSNSHLLPKSSHLRSRLCAMHQS